MPKSKNVERDANAQAYGINADVDGAFSRMESVAACQTRAKQAEAAYEDKLGEYTSWLYENGFIASQWRQADPKDFKLGKHDRAYKAHKNFYDDAKMHYAMDLEKSGDYSDTPLMPLWNMSKKAIEAAGYPKRVHIALVELKDDANQGMRKIRERLETLERKDDDGETIPKTKAQRNADSLLAIYKRVANNEDMAADRQGDAFAALRAAAVEVGCESEYLTLISEV